MTRREHRLQRLGEIDPAWGPVAHISPSSDNRAFLIVTEPEDGTHRYVFGGRVLAESGPHDLMPVSLSFDGAKLAVAKQGRGRGEDSSEIFVNGEKRYEVPFGTVYHFDWLDDERLAWSAWNRDDLRSKDDTIHYFVNGEDLTGKFEFEPVLMDRMRHAIHVKEGDKAYVVYDDGSRSEPVTVPPGTDRYHWFNGLWDRRERPERPEEAWDGLRRSVRVRYRGTTGPAFDGIETFGGMRSYALNKDGRRAAYVGIRYSGPARVMSGVVAKALGRMEGEPRGLSKLWAWPLALLFNPYMGVGHAYIESSRRYFPVDHERAWQKGYRYAHDHFYTPDDELVVIGVEGRGERVVIDEDEGPVFERIINVRHDAAERAVCYLATDGPNVFRVISP
ncbi:MAG TPA: hypothetical protein VL426_02655 [Candidatus Binatia bacterium]|nr:hypothetical protein [Candidatus Binatia bacterium]